MGFSNFAQCLRLNSFLARCSNFSWTLKCVWKRKGVLSQVLGAGVTQEMDCQLSLFACLASAQVSKMMMTCSHQKLMLLTQTTSLAAPSVLLDHTSLLSSSTDQFSQLPFCHHGPVLFDCLVFAISKQTTNVIVNDASEIEPATQTSTTAFCMIEVACSWFCWFAGLV